MTALLLLILLVPCANAYLLTISDQPNDDGTKLLVRWGNLPPPDLTSVNPETYRLERSIYPDSGFITVGSISRVDTTFRTVDTGLKTGQGYYYRLAYRDSLIGWSSSVFGPTAPQENWYNSARTNVLIGIIITGLLVALFIYRGRQGKSLYLRPIAGLQAIDEAIGRATEMGKPILYSAGRGGMARPATMASMNILGSVAEKVATYGTPLIFPNNDPVVMAVAQEVAREAYSKAGHPDAYNNDNIFFVTDSQFGYAAAVDGIMMRERPATNLFFGTFEAESLILAETGNSIGAIQIAGTDSSIQMAFFMVACDYVLIGEELFAASGYLSKDPQVIGSLKGSDISKIIIITLIVLGAILALFSQGWFVDLFATV
ncbi:MAG TPA: hypothetical protein DCZ43_04965 [candidate division Zixibacteria bacterium]|nr:hypothetical protein [candidate division Zixibacteria bacterium]